MVEARLLATVAAQDKPVFKAQLPRYSVTHSNKPNCTMDHPIESADACLKKHAMSTEYTRCVSEHCHPPSEDDLPVPRCPATYRITTCSITLQSSFYLLGTHLGEGNAAIPLAAKVTEQMKTDISSKITADPMVLPKAIYKLIIARCAAGMYDDALCPTFKQVQNYIQYMRSRDCRLKSTVPSVRTELEMWRLNDNIWEQDPNKAFVFGVPYMGGEFQLGDGGLTSFRLGLTTVALMAKYRRVVESNPGRVVLCHMDTTFSTNLSGYPVFVFGYSDFCGSFHLLCICITSTRTHEDVAWLFKKLKATFMQVIGRVKKHIPHHIQEFANHIHDLSEESRPWLDTPVVSERVMKYFKQLCKEELLSFHAVPGARSWHVRQMELRQDAQVHGLDIIQDQQDIACVKYSAISRNIQRLGYVNQPDR
ncbi:hypothetical protein LEN26_016500, partial [Aphanomyces euteiches]